MSFDRAERIADAVLYEGYVLYPYRASSAKNRFRWQFGIVAPKPPYEDGEPWFTQTECLVEPADGPVVSMRLRCLRPRPVAGADGTWLEGVPCVRDIAATDVEALTAPRTIALDLEGVAVSVTLAAEPAGFRVKFRVRVENREAWMPEYERDRDAMLQHSLAGTHLLLSVARGSFVSLLEPPPASAEAVAACANQYTWPVLVGDRGRHDLMLSSPIVLYDYPAVAPESPADLCDGAEIDEILSLRIMTMTDEEKAEARATDPRAREIVDRVEAMTPAALERLHGTMRSADFFNPPGTVPPDEAFVDVGAHRIRRGSAVRLRPVRRADAMDLFLAGQAATVAGVYRDVDDRVYVAVTVDADPAASLHDSFGRYFYFDPSEVEPLGSPGASL